jgi:hypothetical protein
MRKILSIIAIALTASVGVVVADSAPADAAVTNCSKITYSTSFAGRCTTTTAYSPYTTQWALQGTCRRASDGATHGTTTGWHNTSTFYFGAYCSSGYTTYGTPFFIFR